MSDTAVFGAVGDIAFYGGVAAAMLREGEEQPFALMQQALGRADLLFGNMECVLIPESFPAEERDPRGLIAPVPGPFGVPALARAGFHFLNLAANHVLDAGSVGMFYTRECLENAGIRTGGIGATQAEARRLTVLERHGITFGFLCYAEDSNYTMGTTGPCHAYYELETVLEDVARYKASVDILVVSIHADLEFMPTPAPGRRDEARRIAQAGARIILEHHPHVPQGVEFCEGCLIVYSLGNFIFPAHSFDYMRVNGPHTAHSFLLLAEVDKTGVCSFERVPFEIRPSPEERPVPLAGKAGEELRAYFAELDVKLQDAEFVTRTWRDVARRHLAMAIDNAQQQGADKTIDDLVGRLCLLRENRTWMAEVLAMGRERWAAQAEARDRFHRPQYRHR